MEANTNFKNRQINQASQQKLNFARKCKILNLTIFLHCSSLIDKGETIIRSIYLYKWLLAKCCSVSLTMVQHLQRFFCPFLFSRYGYIFIPPYSELASKRVVNHFCRTTISMRTWENWKSGRKTWGRRIYADWISIKSMFWIHG